MGDDKLYLSRGERSLSGGPPRRGRTALLFLAVFGVCFLAALGGLLSVVGTGDGGRERESGPIETVTAAPAVPLAMNAEVSPIPAPAPDAPAPALPTAATVPAVPAAAPAPQPAVAPKTPPTVPPERTRPAPATDLDDLSDRLRARPERDLPDDRIIDEPPQVARGRAGRTPPAPSFACGGRLTPTERMICAEPELARADRRMEAAFRRSLQMADDPERLIREQNRWMRQRERMGQDYAGVMDLYERRIDELWTGN